MPFAFTVDDDKLLEKGRVEFTQRRGGGGGGVKVLVATIKTINNQLDINATPFDQIVLMLSCWFLWGLINVVLWAALSYYCYYSLFCFARSSCSYGGSP